jgi:hypothetical protein
MLTEFWKLFLFYMNSTSLMYFVNYSFHDKPQMFNYSFSKDLEYFIFQKIKICKS